MDRGVKLSIYARLRAMIDPQKVLGFKPYSLGKCFETPPCSHPAIPPCSHPVMLPCFYPDTRLDAPFFSTLLAPCNTALLLPRKLALIAPSISPRFAVIFKPLFCTKQRVRMTPIFELPGCKIWRLRRWRN